MSLCAILMGILTRRKTSPPVPRSEDGEIDWAEPTERIYALIRALSLPWSGVYTYLGTRRITVVRASPVTDAPRYEGRIPRRVVRGSRAGGFVEVLTGDGVLRIYEVMTKRAKWCRLQLKFFRQADAVDANVRSPEKDPGTGEATRRLAARQLSGP